jgi:IS5 family transposase
MAVADRAGLPLAIHVAPAAPAEVRLVRPLLEARFSAALPARLIGDRAYDSDPLDQELAQLGVELIAPHRPNRRKPRTRDGRPLRRYRRRRNIERLTAWLQRSRRVLARHDYSLDNDRGLVLPARTLVLLRPLRDELK